MYKKPPPCITIFTSQYAKYPALILSKFLFIEFAQRHVGRFFRQQQQPHTHIGLKSVKIESETFFLHAHLF